MSLGVSLCVRLCVCVIIKSRLSNFGRKMARCECLPSSSCRCCSLSTSSLNSFCFCCFIFFAHLACFSFRFFFSPSPRAFSLSAFPFCHSVLHLVSIGEIFRFYLRSIATTSSLSHFHLCSQFLFEMPSKDAKSPCPCRGLVPAGTKGAKGERVRAAIATTWNASRFDGECRKLNKYCIIN